MKGYSPKFNTPKGTEVASKSKSKFIELGVKSCECEDNSNCKLCNKNK